MDKFKVFCGNAWQVMKITGRWLYKLRSLVLSIPVAVLAVSLALRNLWALPGNVGINLLDNGAYAFYVNKGIAVIVPLAITALCLLFMYISRRILYPWLVSVFSLALPIVLWITNAF
ncbi:MAG: hypothetical protein IJW41_03520 [Oscillospiraceae bacterium]|nr:hypothetical protein [Oscillospiraceae bacterium]